jgi:hypothetical protein
VRIEVFLRLSPLFGVSRAARNLERYTAHIFQAEGLHLLEGVVLVTAYVEAPEPVCRLNWPIRYPQAAAM